MNKINLLKERIFTKYEYNEPKLFYRYDLNSASFIYSVNEYAKHLYKKVRHLKTSCGADMAQALVIKREELKKLIDNLELVIDFDCSIAKRLVVLKVVVKVIEHVMKGSNKKIKKWI